MVHRPHPNGKGPVGAFSLPDDGTKLYPLANGRHPGCGDTERLGDVGGLSSVRVCPSSHIRDPAHL